MHERKEHYIWSPFFPSSGTSGCKAHRIHNSHNCGLDGLALFNAAHQLSGLAEVPVSCQSKEAVRPFSQTY